MKLVFNKLETPATEIKVSFDGVNYKSYNVNEIKSNGYIQFTEEECPDLTKIKIQGKFSTLASVEVNKAVELERGESGISCTFEKDVFEECTHTYYCFARDNDGNGEINEDDDLMNQTHYWLKDEVFENAEPFRAKYEALPNSVDGLESVWINNPNYNVWLIDENTIGGTYTPDVPAIAGGIRWIRYPEGDLTKTELEKVGTETVTEVITEIQDEPTITESGQTIADEGKAFKSVRFEKK